MPVSCPFSTKVPSPLLWKKKFRTVSLATTMSTQPSSSTSQAITPRDLPAGRPRSSRTWMPAFSVTLVNVPSPLPRYSTLSVP